MAIADDFDDCGMSDDCGAPICGEAEEEPTSWAFGGLEIREVQGRKVARQGQDKAYELRATTWTRYTMEGLIVAMWLLEKNEDRLYPPSLGFKGGKMLRDLVLKCLEDKTVAAVRQRVQASMVKGTR